MVRKHTHSVGLILYCTADHKWDSSPRQVLEVRVEAVTEGERRFMAAWGEEEEGAARHRQEK